MPKHTTQLTLFPTGTKEIPLTQGKVAIVDAADYDWLMQWKWCAYYHRGVWYAMRAICKPTGSHQCVHMHRAILNAPRHLQVDHINGDGLDNTRQNLRLCTNQQNSQNQGIAGNNTSGFKGVSYNKANRKWVAYIKLDGRRIHLGSFSSPQEAARAYDRKALELFGEFARPNF